ncbi:MAG: glycosyltransferase family 2 protein [Tannerella sp.]|jgi:glycosyltransferase involved in cell wall biosynthesis|nr:glycosyltransferase family 2 protein [Tannerella sp.]
MKYPLVSVIIPVYNMSEYVSETLDSVLSSDYPEMEIVVVDDGSTDNSADIIKSYAEKSNKIKLFEQPNKGVSAARNYAIQLSQGEYILPVDADDLISENYIREAVKILTDNPQIKVVSCEVEQFGERAGIIHYPKFSYRLLARKNMIVCSSMFRKSDWAKTGGFCEEEIFREDWDFWISMFTTGGDFFRLPFVGLKYRIRKDSRRHKNITDKKKKMIDAINQRHKAFIYQQLGGKLHYNRTWSRFLNKFF